MNNRWSPTIIAKLSGIGLLFVFMVIIVACGGISNQVTPATPVATITISFGQFIGSPTPPLQGFYCGGWATDATTPYSANGVVNVFGKFVQTDNNNPVGVEGATATATILWPDGTRDTLPSVQTTKDGLAIFQVSLKASAINHIVLIQITFVKDNLSCTIPQAAFFTAILVSPTPTGSVRPSPTGTNTATPTGTPTITPTVGGTSTPSPVPTFPLPSPTPTK